MRSVKSAINRHLNKRLYQSESSRLIASIKLGKNRMKWQRFAHAVLAGIVRLNVHRNILIPDKPSLWR